MHVVLVYNHLRPVPNPTEHLVYYFLPRGGIFLQSIAIEMGGVSRYFQKYRGQGSMRFSSPEFFFLEKQGAENPPQIHSILTLS